MIIRPQSKGFICTTTHPLGCAKNVSSQIALARASQAKNGPRRVLVIGSSTGYGLSSRIMASFGYGAETVGVFSGRPAQAGRTATPGWCNTAAFEQAARDEGINAWSVRGDAFSDETKARTLATLRSRSGPVDLVIYSLAAPRRAHPRTGEIFSSVLKPILRTFCSKTVHFQTGRVSEVSLPPATLDEINGTIAVMGGDDWARWIEALGRDGLLAPHVATLAYSYEGPELTEAIYRRGTIGRAKEDLEQTARQINERLAKTGGRAQVAVMKALVTQASAAIPVMPLYVSLLFKAMKERGLHEGCIEQVVRLFTKHLYAESPTPPDQENRLRLDDWESRKEVQRDVARRWLRVDSHNVDRLADLVGYRQEFFKLFGFGWEGVDFNADVNPGPAIPSLQSPEG